MGSDDLWIGAASAFSGDRADAAGPVVRTLVERGGPAALIFETLAERTLALAQLARSKDPEKGYDPWLDDLISPILADCLKHSIKIVGNFGAANPRAAALRIKQIAKEQSLSDPRIAVVLGDDISGVEHLGMLKDALGGRFSGLDIISANVYQGANAIAAALRDGAQIVVTGRVSDPALCVGPILAHFGWSEDDWSRLGRAVMVGHLLECGAQLTGGYFADPGYKDVPELDRVGYPIARVDSDGNCVVGKADGTGGTVNTHTVTEQLLYEVHDPTAYITPDAIADISNAELEQVGPDLVAMRGVSGHRRPDLLKALVCHEIGWLAEGEISYAGARAESRARLAADVVFKRVKGKLDPRADLIGVYSVLGDDRSVGFNQHTVTGATDVRLRMAASHPDKRIAELLNREVTSLYTCGPAGGGGIRTSLRQRLGTVDCYVSRLNVPATYEIVE